MIKKTSLISLAKNIPYVCSEFFSEIKEYTEELNFD